MTKYLRQSLPDYMIPATISLLSELPLVNGKLNRNALPRPDRKRPGLNQAYVPPKTEIQKQLARIWEEVLDVQPIGIDDHLLDLGAHSLLAAQAITRIIQSFNVELSAKTLFDAPTVAEMAKAIAQAQSKLSDLTLENLVQDIESLSEQEALQLIANKNDSAASE